MDESKEREAFERWWKSADCLSTFDAWLARAALAQPESIDKKINRRHAEQIVDDFRDAFYQAGFEDGKAALAQPEPEPELPEPAAEARWWEQNGCDMRELDLLRKHPEVEIYWGERQKLALYTADQVRAAIFADRKRREG